MSNYSPRSGRIIGEDGQTYNLVDLLGGAIHAIIKPNTTKGFVLRAVSGSVDAKLYRYAYTLRITEILY